MMTQGLLLLLVGVRIDRLMGLLLSLLLLLLGLLLLLLLLQSHG